MINNVEFSIVIPLYKCSASIEELCNRLLIVSKKIQKEFEIILVNDASPENDWEIASKLSLLHENIKSINFSRNFGQHPAIFCGLEYCKGNWIVVMDGDLQDQPEEIEKLYNKALEGYDIVFAKRTIRKDNFLKKYFSNIFYKLFSFLVNAEYDSSIANFGIYHYKTIKAVLSMRDKVKIFPILIQWVGFNKTSISVNHSFRFQGKSSYTLKSLINLAFSIIISFSNKPLVLTIKLGVIISFISFLTGLLYFYRYLNNEILVDGFTSLIISIWFLSGIIIMSIGILGIYISNIFNATKDRPNFIIKNRINLNDL